MNQLLSAYTQFEPQVTAIRVGKSTAEFLGSGAESTVWGVILDDGKYVIKFTNEWSIRNRRRDTLGATQSKIAAGLRGIGINGLEQIVAASLEDRVTVYKYAVGVPVNSLNPEDVERVTAEHFTSLLESIELASEVGIAFDWMNESGTNIFYDVDDGFTLIDYWMENRKVEVQENLLAVKRSLGIIGVSLFSKHLNK